MIEAKKNLNLRGLLVGLVLPLAALLLLRASSGAREEGVKAARKTESGFKFDRQVPITITSSRMEVDRKKSVLVYTGGVVAVQGDMTLRSNTLSATYSEDMKKLNDVVAEGNVRITQGNRVATGTKSVFNGDAQTITLTGNPAVIKQGNSEVSGTRIVFYIEEDRAIAEGGTERVKATIFPEELKKKEGEEAPSGKRP